MGLAPGDSQPIINKDLLRRLAESRLDEARALAQEGHYQGAIYLAGYAVECWLKVAICHTLDWEGLHETFRTHDLKSLLLHSGFIHRIATQSVVHGNFNKIVGMWPKDGGVELRYRDPDSYSKDQAKVFLHWIADNAEGVIPWLSEQVS
jgi:HEPN domain-containing protein